MPPKPKINIKKALKMKLAGASYQDIADAQDVKKASVHTALAPILKQLADPETVNAYRKQQAEILDGLAAKTVANITDDDLAKASLRDKVVSAGILIDKSRLIQGQSTSNSSIMLRAIMDTVGEPVDNPVD